MIDLDKLKVVFPRLMEEAKNVMMDQVIPKMQGEGREVGFGDGDQEGTALSMSSLLPATEDQPGIIVTVHIRQADDADVRRFTGPTVQ